MQKINQISSYRRRELKYRTKAKCDDFKLWMIQIGIFIQVSSKDNVHSSTDGYKTLMKKIPEFQ